MKPESASPRSAKYDYGGLRVIAFSNEKGGVAKTTSCVSLAVCLAEQGRQVLLADMDPQCNATLGIGIDPARLTNRPELLLTDERAPLSDAIIKTDIRGLDLVPASSSLTSTNKALVAEVGRETRLRTKLLEHARASYTKKYDYMLIDCSPSLDLLTLNALMVATDLIVPVQPRYYSLQGMSLIAQTIRSLYRQLDPEIRLLGILITLFDKNTALDHAILSLLRERIEAEFSAGYLFDNVIPRNIQVSETEFGNLPMILSQPEASASISYKAVAQEMLARMEQGQRQG